jgi:hypothetical protein
MVLCSLTRCSAAPSGWTPRAGALIPRDRPLPVPRDRPLPASEEDSSNGGRGLTNAARPASPHPRRSPPGRWAAARPPARRAMVLVQTSREGHQLVVPAQSARLSSPFSIACVTTVSIGAEGPEVPTAPTRLLDWRTQSRTDWPAATESARDVVRREARQDVGQQVVSDHSSSPLLPRYSQPRGRRAGPTSELVELKHADRWCSIPPNAPLWSIAAINQ